MAKNKDIAKTRAAALEAAAIRKVDSMLKEQEESGLDISIKREKLAQEQQQTAGKVIPKAQDFHRMSPQEKLDIYYGLTEAGKEIDYYPEEIIKRDIEDVKKEEAKLKEEEGGLKIPNAQDFYKMSPQERLDIYYGLTEAGKEIDYYPEEIIKRDIEDVEKEEAKLKEKEGGLKIPDAQDFFKMSPEQRVMNYAGLLSKGVVIDYYPQYLLDYDKLQIEKAKKEREDKELKDISDRIASIYSELNKTRVERGLEDKTELKEVPRTPKEVKKGVAPKYVPYDYQGYGDVNTPIYPEGSPERLQLEREAFRLEVERDVIIGYENYLKKHPVNRLITPEKYEIAYNVIAGPVGLGLGALREIKKSIFPLGDEGAGYSSSSMNSLAHTRMRAKTKELISQYQDPTTGRNVFLDALDDYSYIIEEFGEDYLIDMAEKRKKVGY